MNTHTINIELERDVATNKITISNRIPAIKSVREFTFCSLYEAKQVIDVFETEIKKTTPTDTVVRQQILDLVNKLNAGDLIDVLRFATVTRQGALQAAVDEDKQWHEYHECDENCFDASKKIISSVSGVVSERTVEPGTFDEDGNYIPGHSYDNDAFS